jgi:hypothetical protein
MLALAPVMGQSRGESAKDVGDIMNFLVQSQIVEFRPGMSRDPFAAPTERIDQHPSLFLIDEMTIKGRVVINKQAFALILDSMQNARQIPVGFSFIDGVVTAITDKAVIFDQWEANSPSRAGKHSVTKYFKREEEKR